MAALLLVLGVLIWQLCQSQATKTDIIERKNTQAATTQIMEATPATMPTQTSAAEPKPSVSPAPSESSSPKPIDTAKPSPSLFCTLTIRGSKTEVYDSVEESSLKKRPGWLTTSALPGEDGMCVIYGHRNRRHLRVLEKAEIGDEITVTMADGTQYIYTIIDTKIYESTDELRLPAADGKKLVLVTCYPFHYSGSAPGKYMVQAHG